MAFPGGPPDPLVFCLDGMVPVCYVRGAARGMVPGSGSTEAVMVAVLGARERRAVTVLEAGGYFRKQLERAHVGGEKFRTRLRDAHGRVVAGVGPTTFFALLDAGYLARRLCAPSTTWPEEWVLSAALRPVSLADLAVGTRVYTTGDQCNPSGFGTVVQHVPGEQVEVEFDGDPGTAVVAVSQFSRAFEGHAGTRWVTAAAYEAWRAQRGVEGAAAGLG